MSTVRAGLNCKANTLIYALKAQRGAPTGLIGLPGKPGPLILSNAEDLSAPRVEIRVPAEQFPDFEPGAVCFVTISIVQPLIVLLTEGEVDALAGPRAN